MSRSTPLLVIVTASIPRGSLDEGIAAPLVPDLTPMAKATAIPET
jgi:hypothetical protein